jgi:hypothetical protein
MRIGFDVNFMPTAPVLEVVEWAKAVERHRYDLLGISDSQERRQQNARRRRWPRPWARHRNIRRHCRTLEP